jgi:MFS family permease
MERISPRSPLSALGHRYFKLLVAALLSDIGSQTTQTAVALYVFRMTGHNAAYMGLSALSALVPIVLGSPLGGVCAERYSRKWVMIANDLVRIPLVLLLGATNRVWTLLALQSGIAASTALFLPSRQAIIPELVAPEQLNLANTLNSVAHSMVHVLGPILGALLYVAGDGLRWVVALDASTYAASALLLLTIDYRRAAQPSERESMLAEIVSGFRYVRRSSDLLQLLVLSLSAGAAVGILLPLLRPFVGEALQGDDSTYALVIGSFGLGGLIGPLVGYLAGKYIGYGRTVVFGFLFEAALMLIWSRVSSPWLSSAILFLWGINIFAMIPCQNSYLHSHVDKQYMGRTFALLDLATFAPEIAGAGIVALIGSRVSAAQAVTAAAALYLCVVLLSLPSRGARVLRQRSPTTRTTAVDPG